MWKVLHLSSGQSVKAGFGSEEDAKVWINGRRDLDMDEHDVLEMDESEEEDFLDDSTSSELDIDGYESGTMPEAIDPSGSDYEDDRLSGYDEGAESSADESLVGDLDVFEPDLDDDD